MKLDAGRERVAPRVPWLVLLLHAARAIPTDEEAVAVLGLGRIVPTLGSDGHATSIVFRLPRTMKLPVHVWSDIACPWCWIGKRRLERALSRWHARDTVELTYHAFELDPSASEKPEGTYTERLARKYGCTLGQAQQMLADMTACAAEEGITIDFSRVQATNTFDAHRLLHFALETGKQVDLKERILKAYFEEGALVSDHATLVRLASSVGVDEDAARRVLTSDLHARDVRADERDAAELGIRGVPFFVIGRYGIRGAQPPGVLLDVIAKARAEAA